MAKPMTAAQHALYHIRASGPVTFDSVRRWLEDQALGLTPANSYLTTADTLRYLLERDLIGFVDGGYVIEPTNIEAYE